MATSPQISLNGGQILSKAMTLEKTQETDVDIYKIFDDWYTTKQDTSPWMRLRHFAERLYTPLNDALKASSSPMSPADIEAKLDCCLGNDRIGIFQKWWILWVCVENDPDDLAQNLARSLSKVLPSLSLASAENSCDLLSTDAKNEFDRPSPLQRAVERGSIKIFKVMVAEGAGALGKGPFSEMLEKPNLAGHTILFSAVQNCQHEVVRDLLKLGVKTSGDAKLYDSFDQAMDFVKNVPSYRERAICVLSELLGSENGFRTADNLVKAMRTGNEELVNLFMNNSSGPCPFDYHVAKQMIELDLWNIWEFDTVKKISDKLETKGLLHHAVQHQRLQFVEHFLSHTPDAVADKVRLNGETSEEQKYPLWHNNFINTSVQTKSRKDPDPGKQGITKRIRDLLVSTMIKTQKMSVISDIIWDSKGTSCFL